MSSLVNIKTLIILCDKWDLGIHIYQETGSIQKAQNKPLCWKKGKLNRLVIIQSPYCSMKVCTWRAQVFIVNMTQCCQNIPSRIQTHTRWGLYASLLAEWPNTFRLDPQVDPKLQYLRGTEGPEWCVYRVCRHEKCVTGDLRPSKKITPSKLPLWLVLMVNWWRKPWDKRLLSLSQPI